MSDGMEQLADYLDQFVNINGAELPLQFSNNTLNNSVKTTPILPENNNKKEEEEEEEGEEAPPTCEESLLKRIRAVQEETGRLVAEIEAALKRNPDYCGWQRGRREFQQLQEQFKNVDDGDCEGESAQQS